MRYIDLAVILIYLAGITWFGARFRSGQKSLRDYFLGGRTAPWWAIALSIVSAETSTLTIVGTPALAFNGNLGFLQIVLGYLLARIVISFLFLPHYFRGEMFTAYELMRRRFGERIRKLTASIFLSDARPGGRGTGLRHLAGDLDRAGDWRDRVHRADRVAHALLHIRRRDDGGDLDGRGADDASTLSGAVLSFFVILGKIPGGWDHVAAVAGAGAQVHDFRFSLFARHGVLLAHLHLLGGRGWAAASSPRRATAPIS